MRPEALALIAAILWGIWWIPIRHLESLGAHSVWGGIAMSAGGLAAVGLWLLLRRGSLRIDWRSLLGAALVGVAVTTYSTALNHADVVRVILLFYLAPAWGKLIEWALLGHRWGWSSSLALAAALGGALLVLGGEVSLQALGVGDVLAILSGMAWAAGAALMFIGGGASPAALTLATCASGVLTGLLYAALAGVAIAADPMPIAAAGLAYGGLYLVPICMLTLWSAQRLSPATISFILTAEIISGVLSGVLLLDEPFGPMQAAGALLIVLGASIEMIAARGISPQASGE